jgi:hypothetical protein
MVSRSVMIRRRREIERRIREAVALRRLDPPERKDPGLTDEPAE